MQTVFAEKTEDRSLDDNRHIGELFFIRMYWEKGRIPSGNILYWKDAKREDAQINFTGFDGLLLYLDETCEQNGVLLRKGSIGVGKDAKLSDHFLGGLGVGDEPEPEVHGGL